jgi:hypothetical protein
VSQPEAESITPKEIENLAAMLWVESRDITVLLRVCIRVALKRKIAHVGAARLRKNIFGF